MVNSSSQVPDGRGRSLSRKDFLRAAGAGTVVASLPVGTSGLFVGRAEAAPLAPARGVGVGINSMVSTGVTQITSDPVTNDFDDFVDLGLDTLRDGLPWSEVEPVPVTPTNGNSYTIPQKYRDLVQACNDAGIRLILRIGGTFQYGNPNYTDPDAYAARPNTEEERQTFLGHLRYVFNEFKGQVKYYELWNEWDRGDGPEGKGWPDLSDLDTLYVELAKDVYPLLKSIDPSTVLMGPACTGYGFRNNPTQTHGEKYMTGLLEAGLLDYVDAISTHAYNNTSINTPDATKRDPEDWIILVENFQNILRPYNAGKDVPIYITEGGWQAESAQEEAKQASFLARRFALSRTKDYIEDDHWFARKDQGPEHYGVMYGQNTIGKNEVHKLSYDALKVHQQQLKGYVFDKNLGEVPPADPGDYLIRYWKPNEGFKLAAWTTGSTGKTLHYAPYRFATAERAEQQQVGGSTTVSRTSQGLPVELNADNTVAYLALDNRQEIELCRFIAKSDPIDDVVVVNEPNASGGAFESFRADQRGDFVTYGVEAPSQGTYQVVVRYRKQQNHARVSLQVNGALQTGVTDLYSGAGTYQEVPYGEVLLVGGENRFRFNVAGKNASSTANGFVLGIDAVVLKPINIA